MNVPEKVLEMLSETAQSLKDNTFVKLSLGHAQDSGDDLKNIYIRKTLIKKEEKLSFTYRHKTRDIVKNYGIGEALELLQSTLLPHRFHTATLITTHQEVVLEIHKNQKITLRRKETAPRAVPAATHDKTKHRLIASQENPYLHELGITDATGNVYKNAQDKYRQINHYIEILSALLKEIQAGRTLNIADMGSGKGYLTFALYDYLHHTLGVDAHITGIEFRPDLVELCNAIAGRAHFDHLKFVEGTIDAYDSRNTDVLIALHACDTATDDAIFKGIAAGSELIVVAPCCHKQIRREMEKGKEAADLQFLLKHGIFLERQAEMVTDGIRALILEYYGYKTKVFQFISDAHTPKNVMIVASRDTRNVPARAEILSKIQAAKAFFGIGYHHLEKLAGLVEPSAV